jgi:predicted solute-binding protein
LAIPAAAVDDTVSVSDESIELYPKLLDEFDVTAGGGGGGREV